MEPEWTHESTRPPRPPPLGCWEYFAGALPKYRSRWPAALSVGLECFEFALYGAAFEQIKENFFGGSSVLSWACFAVPFVTRPLGGLGFGLLADGHGRRLPVIVVSYGVLIATVGQGCIPGNIGLAGPLLLVTFRACQGLMFGAISSTLVYALEAGGAQTLAFGPMFTQLCGTVGTIAATLLYAGLGSLLSSDVMTAWGWRLPYLLVLPFGLWNAWHTHDLQESEAFERRKASDEPRLPFCEVICRYALPTVLCFLGLIGQGVVTYIRVYLLDWLPLYTEYGSGALPLFALSSLTSAVVLPGLAWATDYYGAAPVMALGYTASAILVVPLFLGLRHSSNIALAAGIFTVLGGMTALIVPSIVFAGQLYPTGARAAAFGTMYNVDNCLFGGLSPALLALWSTKSVLAPAYFLLGCCLLTASGALLSICFSNDEVMCITHLYDDMVEQDRARHEQDTSDVRSDF